MGRDNSLDPAAVHQPASRTFLSPEDPMAAR